MKLRLHFLIFSVFSCPLVGWAQDVDCHAFGRAADRLPASPEGCVSASYRNEGAHLENLFAGSSKDSFQIVRVTSSLPSNIRSMLMASVPFGNMAEWGEDWNSGDIVSRDPPMAQHVISFVSDKVAMVIFRSAGIGGPVTDVLVTADASPAYCVFRQVWEDIPAMLTLTWLQTSAAYNKLSKAGSSCRAKDDLSPLLH